MNKRIDSKVKHKLHPMVAFLCKTIFYSDFIKSQIISKIRYTIDNPEENIRTKIWNNLNGANPWNPIK